MERFDSSVEASKRRLFLFTPAYYPDSSGGGVRQAKILAKSLSDAGVSVTVVAPTISRRVFTAEQEDGFVVERIPVRNFPNLGGKSVLSFLKWTIEVYLRYGAKRYAGIPFYVFHARLHALGPSLAAGRSGNRLLVKLGGGGIASDFGALKGKKFLYGHWTLDNLVRQTAVFVANSVTIEQDLRAYGVSETKIFRLPNGVAVPDDAAFGAAMALRSGKRCVVSCRIVAEKSVATVLEAFRHVLQTVPDAQLTIIGDGPERAALESKFLDLASAGKVEFAGHQSNVFPLLSQGDFYLSASLFEGQSNALLESMAWGLIPIVANASGVDDVVEDGVDGFVVRQPNVAEFAAQMTQALMLDRAKRGFIACGIREKMRRKFGIEAVTRKTIEVAFL